MFFYREPTVEVVDPYLANVSLLLKGDGTNNSPNFVDSSNNNYTITRYGDAKISTDQSKFGGSSISFDGNGDYITAPSDANTDFGAYGDFTVEGWIYVRTVDTKNPIVVDQGTGNFAFGLSPSNQLTFGQSDVSDLITYSFPSGGLANQWHYVVAVRGSGTLSLYVDGVRQATTSNSTNFSSSSGIWVGRRAGGESFSGYMTGTRMTKGTALYSGTTMTIPTTPLSSSGNFLLSYTNAGIPDSAMMNDLETVGNAQVSTSVKKFGTGSIAFDGTGDYLTAADSPSLNLAGGSWTIEGWVYPTGNYSNDNMLVVKRGASSSYQFYLNASSGYLAFYNGSNYTSSSAPTTDRKSTRLNSSHIPLSRMPSSA